MQDFLKEWGPAIITAVAVLAIIGIVVNMKGTLEQSMSGLLADFSQQVEQFETQIQQTGTLPAA